jgi:hypothetical protein
MAGVLFGEMAGEPSGKSCILLNARKIHYWTKAAAVEGIAATGDPGEGSRVTPKVLGNQVFELVQVIILEEEQYNKLKSYPEWRP